MKWLKSHTVQQIGYSFGGQISFLLTNFILFIYLIKGFSPSEYGGWALYITLISIIDGIRQGFVQNGFISEYIKSENKSRLVSTALALNISIIIIAAILAFILTFTWSSLPDETESLLKSGYKTLLSFGLLQFFNSFYHAQKDQLKYLINNLLYLITFICILLSWSQFGTIGFMQVLDIQLFTVLPSSVFFIYVNNRFVIPSIEDFKRLYRFGKYAAGTNLSSLLFHKIDILMIGYFLDPTSVAIYHLTTKVMAYAEIPMQAISQFIYPKLADSLHQYGVTRLNIMYSRSVMMLLVFVIPVSVILVLFKAQLIVLLSSESYLSAGPLVICFALAMLFKPWGRVFGLSLDALGKPRVNMIMLLVSLLINVTLNLVLIPNYGLMGGAIATAVSIITTVLIGQIVLHRIQGFNPLKETIEFTKNIKKHGLSWN